MICLAALLLASAAHAASRPREVYLIQNSGWMEPFYLDPHSPFVPVLHAFITDSALPGAQVTIASFNQAGQLGDLPSPLPLFSGTLTQLALQKALGKLGLPRRADGKYTDADYNGALSDTITTLLSRNPGVIWMVTNNKNSRSNDQHVVENTSRFSTLLTDSTFISAIVAYPLRLPAKGPTFSEKGLVIYGIAYGAEAADWLRQATQSPAMRRLLVAKPVRLKPLTLNPLIMTLAGKGASGVSLDRHGGAIVISGVAGGQRARIDIPARLTSNYYPQVIEQANLQAEWIPKDGSPAIAATITPQTITAMGPDESLDDVHVQLTIPSIARKSSLSGLLQGGTELHGLLRLRLTQVHLVLQQSFLDKMQALFGADAQAVGNQVMRLDARKNELPAALPAVFLGHQAVVAAATDVPVSIQIAFSALPLELLLATIVVALLMLAGGLVAISRERRYEILVGGDTMTVQLRPFRSTTVRSRSGVSVAVTAKLLGKPKVETRG